LSWRGRVNPGKVFDHGIGLDDVADVLRVPFGMYKAEVAQDNTEHSNTG
jgi:hypothetical protein